MFKTETHLKEMRHIYWETTAKKFMIALYKNTTPKVSAKTSTKLQPIQFLCHSWQEAFPSPFFLNPSSGSGGRAEGTQSMQMLTFHSLSCAHIRSEWRLL